MREPSRFLNDDRKPSPIPLEECPWCGTKFKRDLLQAAAERRIEPEDLRISCVNRECEFGREFALPIVAVDEPIYRRLPCFIIATVDKFAASAVDGPGRRDSSAGWSVTTRDGFYGPCDPAQGSKLPDGRLLPPDLVIQDELHLISGPLGTMAGLYETALDELCVDQQGRPQGQAEDHCFDGDGAARRDSDSCAVQLAGRWTSFRRPVRTGAIRFLPRRCPRRRATHGSMLASPPRAEARRWRCCGCTWRCSVHAQKWYTRLKKKGEPNPADPYMTLVGYYNACGNLVERGG